jgi:hypothetical protein
MATVIKGCGILIVYAAMVVVYLLRGWSSLKEGCGLLANENDRMHAMSAISFGIGVLCLVAVMVLAFFPLIGGERAWWPITILVYVLLAVGVLCVVCGLVFYMLASENCV